MKKMLLSIAVIFAWQILPAQLTIYSGFNLQGATATCLPRTVYIGTNIPNGLNNKIKSISLAKGYMATFADSTDGTGERFTYMANKSDININLSMPLQNNISFIRVLRLPANGIKKKGACSPSNTEIDSLNVTWFYDWGYKDYSTPTREYAPMAWSASGAYDVNLASVMNKDSLTHYLAFNEPDHVGQANMTVAASIPWYKNILKAGQRMGSPAAAFNTWLDTFTTAAQQQKLNIDFVTLHWYDWGNYLTVKDTITSATGILNRLKSTIAAVYDRYKKPIWITEFNANEYRTDSVHIEFMKIALPWLDSDPRVERYSYFFGNDVYSVNPNGTLTAAGRIYANHTSVDAYPENIYDTRPAFPISLAAWEASAVALGGLNQSTFVPTRLDNNMTAPQPITRGSGVGSPFTNSSNGYWGGTSFSTTTADDGIAANKFFTFSLKSKNGKAVNYYSINKTNIRLNASSPIQYEVEYKLDNGNYYHVATLSGPARATGNYTLDSVDLSSIAGLQDVPPTSTITFRIIPFDASGTGSFLIGSGVNDTLPDLEITGGFSDANFVTTSLPVTLANFQLQHSNTNKTLLQWHTNTEVNFSHFELQRSYDATTFITIATIAGNNQLNGSNYSYVDIVTANITKYYRLKMVDKDGSIAYSNILVDAFNNGGTTLMVYPTVSNGATITAVFTAITIPSQLFVVKENGQIINTYQLSKGATSQAIETRMLAKGVYFLCLVSKVGVEKATFIK